MKTTINLRIDEDLKTSLQELSDDYGVSLSDYIREILDNHLNDFTSEVESFDIVEDNELPVLHYPLPPFERTYEFTVLLAWLFYSHMQPEFHGNTNVLHALKVKVEKTINQSRFSKELQLELLKVLNDINRCLIEPNDHQKYFTFSRPGSPQSLNYYLLMNEIWRLEFEDHE
ncbi:ribbon-helix-helix protein, CopG family [Maribacter aurantiacus]|uniref:Ribbon-helix-helix protein, CopG family n=1 Tax=Maribacter aurantiacus TaxID=1882343 RepID=A0A5R8MEH0_9FLAO|nr:ribbon-helix-helix protein, CopG family [Maribacter aurantiacus]TLF47119.1 ribbon-helix-helix protein, CopG family [Maribacter aurantiacus]